MSLLLLLQDADAPPIVAALPPVNPGNVTFGYGNRIDGSTLSGGSWEASLPLSNLKTRRLGRVARSTNLDPASTKLTIDLGKVVASRAIGMANHNAGIDALWRVRAWAESGLTTLLYDSDWVEIWPPVYESTDLDWEADNWWDGKFSEDERDRMTWTRGLLAESTAARYWTIEIDDQENPDGWFQLGRVFIGPAWQPEVNMEVGASRAWEDQSSSQRSISGALTFDERNVARVVRCELPYIAEADGRQAFDMMRRMGVTGEILFFWNPSDEADALRGVFLAHMRQLSPLEYPIDGHNGAAFEIEELP